MNVIYVKIEGMHCNHCYDTVKNALLKIRNVQKVEISGSIATIYFIDNLSKKKIIKAITDVDYITKEEYINVNKSALDSKIKFKEFMIIFIIIIFIYLIIYKIFGFNIFNVIPTIDSNITYTMLIVTGLLTSIHCISMCGAINLVAVINKEARVSIIRPIMYNMGRLISYTIIGGVVGLLGSVISINNTINFVIILLSSLLMFFMGLKMLGIVHFKLPIIRVKHFKTGNSFIIGLLNGLMPCGPLQAMQVYALSTGSFYKGALSMFMFGIGTIPLMLFMGLVVNFVTGKRKIIINKIASVLILILSLVMLNRAFLTIDIDIFKNFKVDDSYTQAIIYDDYQIITFDLTYDNYLDFIVLKDKPVKMIINVEKNKLTGCNSEIIMNEYGIKQTLKEGRNEIIFVPTEEGTFTYTCWMNMITNNIKVVSENYFEEEK